MKNSRLGKGQAIMFLALSFASAMARADIDAAKATYVRGDHATAFVEFRKAAELGHPEAQFNLGATYYGGQGVTRSPPSRAGVDAARRGERIGRNRNADCQRARRGWCEA